MPASADATPAAAVIAPAPTKSHTDFQGNLKFEGTQYITSSPESTKLNQTQALHAHIGVNVERGDLNTGGPLTKGHVDIVAAQNVNFGTAYMGLNELYFQIAKKDAAQQSHYSLSVGRRIDKWSQLDSSWQLGAWQPNYGEIDLLKPIDQGLTGVFWNQREGEGEVLAFATAIFIPSMGPVVKERDGTIESDSRWYRRPSTTFAWQGVVTRIVYSLDVPDIGKLVSKPGAGIRYSWGEQSEGFATAVNYGYKPINSLLLKYKTVLRTPEVGPRGEVSVSPEVGYHQIYGADMSYSLRNFRVVASVLQDRPATVKAEENWFQQQPEPFQAASLHMDTTVSTSVLADPVVVSVDYLKVNGGLIHDVDSSGENQGALLAERFQFYDAVMLKMQFGGTLFRKPMTTAFKALREFQQKGNILGFEWGLAVQKNWMLSAGFDILGVDDETSTATGFVNQFRANDRYYGGLSYVF